MEALQISEWGGKLEQVEREQPTPESHEVLVEVDATSVGLTVANVINGDLASESSTLPRIPGHEIIGTVVETGDGVSAPAVGERIAAYFYLSCDRCPSCRRGREPLCENLEGYVSVDIDGGFAEYVALPASNAIPIPSSIDPIDATAIPDSIATPYHVMNQRVDVGVGDDVLVLGAGGGVGIHLVQMARLFGSDVTAADIGEEKLHVAAEQGAERTIDTSETDLDTALDDERFDAVIDFTGVMPLVRTAVDYLGRRGRLVNLTTFPGKSFELTPREQVFNELEVVGSRYCSKYELRESAQLVAEGAIEPIVTEVADLDGTPALLDSIRDGEVVGRAAMTPG